MLPDRGVDERARPRDRRRWPRARARVGPGAVARLGRRGRRRAREPRDRSGGASASPVDADGSARGRGAGRRRRRRPRRRRPGGAARPRCRRRGRRAWSARVRPDRSGARLEGSKRVDEGGARRARACRPPRTRAFGAADEDAALAFLATLDGLYVVKTDGLAAGKGVLVTESLAEADDAVRSYLSGEAFGDAGRTVVIEEGLRGPELSLLVRVQRRSRRGGAARAGAGLQARSATATPARTPAAWARTRRSRSSAPRWSSR